jgi:hypothetical protein
MRKQPKSGNNEHEDLKLFLQSVQRFIRRSVSWISENSMFFSSVPPMFSEASWPSELCVKLMATV